MRSLETIIEDVVGLGAEWIDVGSQCSGEEQRILRDNGHFGSQVIQANLRYVDPVNDDGATGQLTHSEKRNHDGGLARTRPAHDTNFFGGTDRQRKALEYIGQLLAILHPHIIEANSPFGGPSGRRSDCFDLVWGFLLQFVGVVHNSLCTDHVVFDLGKLPYQP